MQKTNLTLGAILILNFVIFLLVFNINGNEHSHKKDGVVSQSSGYQLTSVRDLEQQYSYLSHQIQKLSLQLENVQTHLIKNKNNQFDHAKAMTLADKSEDDFVLDDKTEQADEVGFVAVDTVLVSGSLDQDGVVALRQVMSNMSSEAHHKALRKLIIAINNGNLVMQPGAVL